MGFQIATSLAGQNVWFEPGETVPSSMSNVRPAPPRIAELAAAMLAEDASGEISDDTAAQMRAALDAI